MEFLTAKFGQTSQDSLEMRHQDFSMVRSLFPVVVGLGRVVRAMQERWWLAVDEASPEVGDVCGGRTLPVQKRHDKETCMWY